MLYSKKMIKEEYVYANIRDLRRGLELGCGYGNFMLRLLKKGFDVYGIDICDRCVKHANDLFRDYGFGERCYVKNAESLSFHDNSFDFIYVIISLHEMNVRRVAKESFRVLRRRGRFIDVDWAPWASTGAFEKYYSIEEVRRIFEYIGFTAREAFYEDDLEYILFKKNLNINVK